MPFQNPLANGAVLVRQAIRSPDYLPGVSGWSINRDGSVDVNDGTFRGTVVVGTPPSIVTIADVVPAELVTFYAAKTSGAVANACLLFFVNATDYYYQLVGLNVALDPQFMGEGWVIGGAVNEIRFVSFFGAAPGAPIINELQGLAAGVSGGAIRYGLSGGSRTSIEWDNADLTVTSGSTLALDSGVPFTIDAVEQPRGRIFYDQVTAARSTTTATTEQEVYNTSTAIAFPPGRAYRVLMQNARIKSTSVQQPAVNLREASVGGALLIQGARFPITIANIDLPYPNPGWIISNTSGLTVHAALSLTLTPNAAAAVTLNAAAGAGAWGFEVVDIGTDVDYPSVSL